jgi:hypothetical protein
MGPARNFTESLTPDPELENSQGQELTLRRKLPTSALHLSADLRPLRAGGSSGPKADMGFGR